jgi:hypothetical protein
MISNVSVVVTPFNSVPMFGTEETGGSLSLGQKGPTETVGWRKIALMMRVVRAIAFMSSTVTPYAVG